MAPRNPSRLSRERAKDAESFEWLTVAWMLTVVTTLVCELIAGAAAIYVLRIHPPSVTVRMLGDLLLFAATVTGTVSLLLLPITVRLRSQPIPTPVMVMAVVIGAIPWLVLALQMAS